MKEIIRENKERILDMLSSLSDRHNVQLPLEAAQELITFILLSQMKTSLTVIGKYKNKEAEVVKQINEMLNEYELKSKVRK